MSPPDAAGNARSEPFRVRSSGFALVACATGVAAALGLAGAALAQSSGGIYTLEAQSIAGGGGRSSGGVFALEGTIARHDASDVLGGGVFELTGGFHQRAQGAPSDALFGDGFEGT